MVFKRDLDNTIFFLTSQSCFILSILSSYHAHMCEVRKRFIELCFRKYANGHDRVASSSVQGRENRSLEEILNFISERDILSWGIINGNPAVCQIQERSCVKFVFLLAVVSSV